MEPITGRVPIDGATGCQSGTAGGSWQALAALVTVPPAATGAILYTADPLQFAYDTVGSGINGIVVQSYLALHQQPELARLCLRGGSFTIQFFTGPTGKVPTIEATGGGGGGGGVSSVGADAPITSSGGTTPVIGLQPGNPLEVLVSNGRGWDYRTTELRPVRYVSPTLGDDSFPAALIGSRLYPYATIDGANTLNGGALPGTVIHLLPGDYSRISGTWSLLDGVTYYTDAGVTLLNGVIVYGGSDAKLIGHGQLVAQTTVAIQAEDGSTLDVELPIIQAPTYELVQTSGNSTVTIKALHLLTGSALIRQNTGTIDIQAVDIDCQWAIGHGNEGTANIHGRVYCRNTLVRPIAPFVTPWNVCFHGSVIALTGSGLIRQGFTITFRADVEIPSVDVIGTLIVSRRAELLNCAVSSTGFVLLESTARIICTDPNPTAFWLAGPGKCYSCNAFGTHGIDPGVTLKGSYILDPDVP